MQPHGSDELTGWEGGFDREPSEILVGGPEVIIVPDDELTIPICRKGAFSPTDGSEPQGNEVQSDDDEDDDADSIRPSTGAVPLNDERKAARKLLKGTKIWFESSLRDVVILNAKEIGFTMTRKQDDADIVWVEHAATFANDAMRSGVGPHQRINLYPGMKFVATKLSSVGKLIAWHRSSGRITSDLSQKPSSFPVIDRCSTKQLIRTRISAT